MTERESFVAAICDDPDDDALRLVFADWLEEQGDPQAGVIQRQIAEPDRAWHFRPGDPALCMGYGGLAAVISPALPRIKYTVRRGFVEQITCPWDAWAEHYAAILAQQPVRKVTLTTWPELQEERAAAHRLLVELLARRQRAGQPPVVFEMPRPMTLAEYYQRIHDAHVIHAEIWLRNPRPFFRAET